MTYTQRFYSRKSIRLREYDYSQQGLYFITICTQNRACLFGSIDHSPNNDSTDTNLFNNNSSPINKSVMILNDAGKFANECWMEIPKHFPHVILHEFIIMPNHIHGIIELTPVGANNHSPSKHSSNIHMPNYNLMDNYCNANEWLGNNANEWDINETKKLNENNANEWDENRANNYSPLRGTSKTIGSVVRGFKIGVTKWMRQHTNVYDVWQRNYHEHIIRNEQSYFRISEYIIQNPYKWKDDRFYL